MADVSRLEGVRARFASAWVRFHDWFGRNWRDRRWFRYLASLAGAGVVFLLALWLWLSSDLPDAESLLEY